MKENLKQLLFKDLCSRLPYRVICQCDKIKAQGVLKEISLNYNICRLYDSFTDEYENCFIFNCRPYLFPLSSMTDEQKEEFNTQSLKLQLQVIDDEIMYEKATEFEVDFYNKHHLDWRGLIPMGLANDATGLNIY